MESFDYLHIAVGTCRLGKYNIGDIVEISSDGYDQGIHELHVECFGEVVDFKDGLLSVIIYGEDKAKQYHPCFWYVSDGENYVDWRSEKAEIDIGYC